MKKYINDILGATVDLTNKRIFFWGGIFSQWHKSTIVDNNLGIEANCAEQLMMAYKAITFGDTDAMNRILATDNARKQKDIGRGVKGYVDEVWKAKRLDVVKQISYLKFDQNKAHKDMLIMTDGFEIVEASPEDAIWGIGMGEHDPDIFDKAKWKGTNLLGIAIMDARDRILSEL